VSLFFVGKYNIHSVPLIERTNTHTLDVALGRDSLVGQSWLNV